MPRYNDRLLHLKDLVPLFEEVPSSIHARNALGAIQRLRDDARTFGLKDASQLARWRRACNELCNFINHLGKRRDIEKQDLTKALREFFHAFEHGTDRMFQMLHSRPDASPTDPVIERFVCWIDLVFRLSTYAIVSYWIDDKTEERLTNIKMTMNPTTGKTTVQQEHQVTKPMRVPKKYRHTTRKI